MNILGNKCKQVGKYIDQIVQNKIISNSFFLKFILIFTYYCYIVFITKIYIF